MDLNDSTNKSTIKISFELLYGYASRREECLLHILTVENERNLCHRPEVLQERAREDIRKEQQKYKKRFDQHRYRNVRYDVGKIFYTKAAPLTDTGTQMKSSKKREYL